MTVKGIFAHRSRGSLHLLGAAAPLLWFSIACAYAREEFSLCAMGTSLALFIVLLGLCRREGRELALGPWAAPASGLALAATIAPLLHPGIPAAPFWFVGGIGAGIALARWFDASASHPITAVAVALTAGIIAADVLLAITSILNLGSAGNAALDLLSALLVFTSPGSPPDKLAEDEGNAALTEQHATAPDPDPRSAEGSKPSGMLRMLGMLVPFGIASAYYGFAHKFPLYILGDPSLAFPYALLFACLFCIGGCLWFLAAHERREEGQGMRIIGLALAIILLVAVFADRFDKLVLLGMQLSGDDVALLSIWVGALTFVRESERDARKAFLASMGIISGLEAVGALVSSLGPVGRFLTSFPDEGVFLFSACAFAAMVVGVASVASLVKGAEEQNMPTHMQNPPDSPLSSAPGNLGQTSTPQASHAGLPRELQFLDERCSKLGEEHGLTEREIEIMRLLALGRSRPHIAETLFLSQNTVKWYCRQIYQKLDIHSKQELLSLLGIE